MLRFVRFATAFLLASSLSVPALASDEPIYAPAPAWISVTPVPAAMTSAGDAGPRFDWQERFENGQTWNYSEVAMRISSAAMLTQAGTITLPWFPDKGDLIIHEVSILRDGKVIDLLAQGQKFKVLQREQLLEQLELTGILTATFVPEGLQVGDILRIRASITVKDAALGNKVQWSMPLLADPAKVSAALLTASWPVAQPVKWATRGKSAVGSVTRKGAYDELRVSLPLAKQPDKPSDAPQRFKAGPAIEVSGFSDWRDVSSSFAPLYGTQAVPEGSPLAIEIARIMSASTDPLRRAALGLRSVQDNVRYLSLGMAGGNYIPQTAIKTWQVRYGDCKAKTLLLITMLKAMGISSEPVLANASADDLVPGSLPAPQAFNHVFVRAKLGDKTLWLDGTRAWTRDADLLSEPPFRNLLAIRPGGAQLEQLAGSPPVLPSIELLVEADDSTSVDLPTVANFTVAIRREMASALSGAIANLGLKERKQFLNSMIQDLIGEGQYVDISGASDPDAGTFTIKARGILTTPWKTEDGVRKRRLSRVAALLSFSPDRSKPDWAAIPVSINSPDRQRFTLRLRLPENGRGVISSGDLNFDATVGGVAIKRTGSIKEGVVEIDELYSSSGGEIAPERIAAERDLVARALGRAPQISAPADTLRRWEIKAKKAVPGTQFDQINAILAEAIKNAEPDDSTPFTTRASLLIGVGDSKSALADLDCYVALTPSADAYIYRGRVRTNVGDIAGALADFEAARKLDPASTDAISEAAFADARLGKLDTSIALLDERIELGGESSADLKGMKAAILGEFGDAQKAIAIIDDLLVKKPGNPSLLNQRCWIKATRQIMLDSALKDCTKAVELTDNTAQVLDSRALVWMRLGKYDDALADIDATLLEKPDQGPSRFLRGLILQKLGRAPEAKKDIDIAKLLAPYEVTAYAKFGLTP